MTYTDDMRQRVRDYDREHGIYVVSCAAPEEQKPIEPDGKRTFSEHLALVQQRFEAAT